MGNGYWGIGTGIRRYPRSGRPCLTIPEGVVAKYAIAPLAITEYHLALKFAFRSELIDDGVEPEDATQIASWLDNRLIIEFAD